MDSGRATQRRQSSQRLAGEFLDQPGAAASVSHRMPSGRLWREYCARAAPCRAARWQALLSKLKGPPRLMGWLLCGSGLRLQDCVTLRVKDVDFATRQLLVRHSKGRKDRAALRPASLVEALQEHFVTGKERHERDLADGPGSVELPGTWPPSIPKCLGNNRGSACFLRPECMPIRP